LGIISSMCYKWTNVKSLDLIWILRGWFSTWKSWSLTWKSSLWGWGHNLGDSSLLLGSLNVSFSLKEKVSTWKFDLSGLEGTFVCFFSSHVTFKCFLFVERKGLDLKVDLRGRWHIFVCLFSLLGIFNCLSFLLEEKVLILKAFLWERESLIWGRVFHLGVILPFYRNDLFSLVGIPFALVGVLVGVPKIRG